MMHFDPVEVWFVGESELMRSKRRRLVAAAAAAVSRAKRTSSPLAHAILCRTARIASEWQFADVTEEQLQDALIGLTGLFTAANAFERAEAADA